MPYDAEDIMSGFELYIEVWQSVFLCSFDWSNDRTRQWAEPLREYAFKEPGNFFHEAPWYYAAFELMPPSLFSSLSAKQQSHLHEEIESAIRMAFVTNKDGLCRVDGKLQFDCTSMLARIGDLLKEHGEVIPKKI